MRVRVINWYDPKTKDYCAVVDGWDADGDRYPIGAARSPFQARTKDWVGAILADHDVTDFSLVDLPEMSVGMRIPLIHRAAELQEKGAA